ncbi:3'-5' exonuclease [Gordonia alkaliphila]|uniref:exonuclease domain-containing protein n=1 Tax=Gordonia alkaliphila TaxID=1053547 RepID=UPI001FF4A309|nr:exonuclease domain-containing protein [Gordonia alkaliphila]MCK0441147.1 3'-5' exonuclease [Gordonia alkaliphila]
MWLPEYVVGFDLETTSADPGSANIVSYALVHGSPGNPPAAGRSSVVDPGIPISPGAMSVHGITDERARAEGMNHAAAVDLIGTQIRHAWQCGAALVVYNAPFDLSILDRHTPGGFSIDGPVIDPLVLSRMFVRSGSHRLSAVASTFGIALTDAHDAYADASSTVQIAWVLLEQLRRQSALWEVPVQSAEEFMVLQQRAAVAHQQLRCRVGERVGWPRLGDLRMAVAEECCR